MINELKGLRYPDEYVIKFFFKEGLQKKAGSLLELGCGSGNNLRLFTDFGWRVAGIDYDAQPLADAQSNFRVTSVDASRYELLQKDLSNEAATLAKASYDCVLLPNILCYFTRETAETILSEMASRLKPGGRFFVRTRTPKDYRYGKGKEVARNTFVLDTPETGEKGLLNCFYTESELVAMLSRHFKFKDQGVKVMQVEHQNLQQDRLISNSDVVAWLQV